MVYYTITPNKERTGWFLKKEAYTPQETYDKFDDAVDAAYKEAEKNQPSTLTILNEAYGIQETKIFR